MTKIPSRSCKELLRRRAVQVNVVLVRKHKLDQTKGVVWPRLLPNGELACPEFLKNLVAHGTDSNHLSVLRDNFVVLTCDVIAIALNRRNEFRALDTWWHIPI